MPIAPAVKSDKNTLGDSKGAKPLIHFNPFFIDRMHSSATRIVKSIVGLHTKRSAKSMNEEVVKSGQISCKEGLLLYYRKRFCRCFMRSTAISYYGIGCRCRKVARKPSIK